MIEDLYEKYHQELVGWCRRMTGDLSSAQELVQDAFLRAMLHGQAFSALKEHQQRAWLYRTVKNSYIDRLRHTRRETFAEHFPAAQTQQEELAAVEWKSLLDSLPGMEGVLFTMRYVEGYTSKQIGELLQLPPGTVRSKLSSARKRLRDALR